MAVRRSLAVSLYIGFWQRLIEVIAKGSCASQQLANN